MSSDHDGNIVKTGIMSINMPTYNCTSVGGRMKVDGCTVQVVDLWVFDDIVAAYGDNGQLYFFEKPMVLGGTRDPLPVVTADAKVVDITQYKFLAYDMDSDHETHHMLEFFGVLKGGIEKW